MATETFDDWVAAKQTAWMEKERQRREALERDVLDMEAELEALRDELDDRTGLGG